MAMLAEVVDAVIGIDTHRDTHEVEIAMPPEAGRQMRISNDSAGFARLLAWIAEVAPGPRVAVWIEGSRSYGIGLARALAPPACWSSNASSPTAGNAAGRASPTRSMRTWPCWPRCAWTPTGCRLLVLTVTAKHCASCWAPGKKSPTASTAQTSRLRALLLAGDDTDRQAARSP